MKGTDYREAKVSFPVVTGLPDHTILRKVQTALSLKAVFDSSLEELRADFKESTWLEGISYVVHFNRLYILDLTFSQSGMGAYPDTQYVHVLINLKTGDRLKSEDVFERTSFKPLAVVIDQAMQADMRRSVKLAGKWEEDGSDVIKMQLEGKRFRESDLNSFSVGNKGVTFLYDFGFPHVIKAAEPAGRYFLSYQRLRPYIKLDGLLAEFLR